MKTLSFASLVYEQKKKKTRREQFLVEMDEVIPWDAMVKIIRPHYPKAGNGRQPMRLEMDAEDIFPAAMVWSVRPCDGRCALRYRSDKAMCGN